MRVASFNRPRRAALCDRSRSLKNGRGRSNSFSHRFFQSHPSHRTSCHSAQTLLGQPLEPRKNDRTCRHSFASSLKAVVPGSFPGRSDFALRTPFPEPGASLAENTRAAAHPYGTPTRELQLCPWAHGPTFCRASAAAQLDFTVLSLEWQAQPVAVSCYRRSVLQRGDSGEGAFYRRRLSSPTKFRGVLTSSHRPAGPPFCNRNFGERFTGVVVDAHLSLWRLCDRVCFLHRPLTLHRSCPSPRPSPQASLGRGRDVPMIVKGRRA